MTLRLVKSIKIGSFTIRETSMVDDDAQNQKIWINNWDGEGGEFQISDLEKVIAKFFEENM